MGRIHSEFGNLSDQSVPAGLVLRQEPDEEEEEEEHEDDSTKDDDGAETTTATRSLSASVTERAKVITRGGSAEPGKSKKNLLAEKLSLQSRPV